MNRTEKYLVVLINKMSKPSKELYFYNTYTKEKKHMKPLLKLAIIFAAVFLLSGSVPVMAHISDILERLQNLPEGEMIKLAEMTNQQGIEADLYSRELSEDERNRMITIRELYENGFFPEGSITVLSEGETTNDDFYYNSDTGMFFLPENRNLTDQELAELVDFYYKRDYSLRTRGDNEETFMVESTENEMTDSVKIPDEHIELINKWLPVFDIDGNVLSEIKIQSASENDNTAGCIYSYSGEEYDFTCTINDDCIIYFKREDRSYEKNDLTLSENDIKNEVKKNTGIFHELENLIGNDVKFGEAWLLYKLDNEGSLINDTYAVAVKETGSDIGWYISFEHENTRPSVMRQMNIVNYFESIENGEIIAKNKGINDKIIKINIENGDYIE